MTSTAARTVANVVLVSAGVGIACLVWRRPALRRVARVAIRAWLGGGVPAYLLFQAGRAWLESDRAA